MKRVVRPVTPPTGSPNGITVTSHDLDPVSESRRSCKRCPPASSSIHAQHPLDSEPLNLVIAPLIRLPGFVCPETSALAYLIFTFLISSKRPECVFVAGPHIALDRHGCQNRALACGSLSCRLYFFWRPVCRSPAATENGARIEGLGPERPPVVLTVDGY